MKTPCFIARRLNSRSTEILTVVPASTGSHVAADPTAPCVFSPNCHTFVIAPNWVASYLADALNAAQTGVALAPGPLLLVSDVRDFVSVCGAVGRRTWLPKDNTYQIPSAAHNELARREAAGWRPNLPSAHFGPRYA